tara:strand:- start:424 stop:702 length:279 start_codon:yes stop_codon:yes gene_type:complete
MEKAELINSLYDRALLQDDEEIILSDGFEAALIGISASEPKVAIYDYWKSIDCVMKAEPNMSFDEALEWLEEFVTFKVEKVEELTPIFIKSI